MRVALFTETYIPNINGVVTHVKTLRDGLDALGHDVLVVYADKHTRHHYIEEGVLHCPALEMKRFYGFGAALPFSQKRQRLISNFNPDVIHIHHEFGIGISGITASKRQNKPLVYTLHTMYDQYIYYIAPKPFLQAATKFSHKYEKFIAQRATELTGPSLKCDEYFKMIGVDREVNVIPNAVDLNAFDPTRIRREDKDAFRAKYGIPGDVMAGCFAGRLGKEKSVDLLLEYWAKTITPADKTHLVIIGDGPEKPVLEEMAQRLGIADMVTFTGMIKHPDMPACYAGCDVYITASLSDTNSISMLEGMATGLPVLQLYDELNKDQIKDGINGYTFDSPEQMAQRLRELKSMPESERQKIRASVMDSVVERGATYLASYILGVYQKAIDEKAALPPKVHGRRKFYRKNV